MKYKTGGVSGEREEGSSKLFRRRILVLGSLSKEIQKDMDEKMDVLMTVQKNNKLCHLLPPLCSVPWGLRECTPQGIALAPPL